MVLFQQDGPIGESELFLILADSLLHKLLQLLIKEGALLLLIHKLYLSEGFDVQPGRLVLKRLHAHVVAEDVPVHSFRRVVRVVLVRQLHLLQHFVPREQVFRIQQVVVLEILQRITRILQVRQLLLYHCHVRHFAFFNYYK